MLPVELRPCIVRSLWYEEKGIWNIWKVYDGLLDILFNLTGSYMLRCLLINLFFISLSWFQYFHWNIYFNIINALYYCCKTGSYFHWNIYWLINALYICKFGSYFHWNVYLFSFLGNMISLKTNPVKNRIDVYSRLKEFHKQMYSAHYMTLVVQSRGECSSLDIFIAKMS